jgi:peptidyl-prolyl cis-trans isomerase D
MIRILQQDNRTTKIIFAVIIGLAIVTMVITLVPGIFSNVDASGPSAYATVRAPGFFGRLSSNSETIKQEEVDQLAQQELAQQRLPDFLLPYAEQSAGLRLIQRAVLKHEADRLHLQVTDDDLRRELRTGSLSRYIFPDGKYIGDDAYINFIQAAFGPQYTRETFEAQVKEDMELNRLQSLITGGVNVSDAAVNTAYRIAGTKVKFDYAVLSSDDLKNTINPTDAQLQQFFAQNKVRYAQAVPETRKIEYVSFDASALPGGKPQISDAEVAAYYSAHHDQFKTEESVKTRHILITVPAGADAKVEAPLKAKAEQILQQVKSGADFAELARKDSDDPGSKALGGELPMMPTASLDPAYAKAAMALNPGQTSGLVRSQFGYHIIQTEAKQQAGFKPLAAVVGQIRPVLEQQKLGAAEQQFAQALAKQVQSQGFDKAAAAHNLHPVTTDYLPKGGTIAGLADSTALMTQAFATAKGAAPQTASSGDGFAVFQVLDTKAAHAPDFASYKDHILADYREQQVPTLLNDQLKKLDDRAKVLNDLTKAATEMHIPVKSSDLVAKDAQVPDLGAMSGPGLPAFSLPKGGISGPINTGRTGVVLEVTDKQEPTAADMQQNFAATRDHLLSAQREDVFRVYVTDLVDKYTKAGAIVRSQTADTKAVPPIPGS